MKLLIWDFLKTFFRNPRALFFAIFLPAGIFLALSLLGVEGIVRYDDNLGYKNFLLTGIIALAVMQTGIYTVAYTFIDYHKRQILKRLAVTPLTVKRLLLAQVMARFFIALFQTVTLLVIGGILFEVKIETEVWVLPILIFLGNTIFLNLGFIIAAVTRDYERAAPLIALAGMILLFLGDVFFPVEHLPRFLETIAKFLPLSPFVSLIRGSLWGILSPDFFTETAALLAWLTFSLLLSQYLFAKKIYK